MEYKYFSQKTCLIMFKRYVKSQSNDILILILKDILVYI